MLHAEQLARSAESRGADESHAGVTGIVNVMAMSDCERCAGDGIGWRNADAKADQV
jgi:hypothetical protein